jgi:hypothetical protein
LVVKIARVGAASGNAGYRVISMSSRSSGHFWLYSYARRQSPPSKNAIPPVDTKPKLVLR